VIVLGEYEAELRELILRMKTDRSGFLARVVTQLLVRQRAKEFRETPLDLIIPVPMYWFRRWVRGVNSPDILAEELGRILKVPVASELVQRIRPTEVQYLLSAHNRAGNVANAFAVKRVDEGWYQRLVNGIGLGSFWWRMVSNRRVLPNYSDLSGKNILLVDDIFTTGSTCNEVAKVLHRAGVRSVTVCTFARAVGFYTQRRAHLLEKLAKKR
jgi:predicted amidophosphoribosyltransferase